MLAGPALIDIGLRHGVAWVVIGSPNSLGAVRFDYVRAIYVPSHIRSSPRSYTRPTDHVGARKQWPSKGLVPNLNALHPRPFGAGADHRSRIRTGA